jgi:hypothetical protein
MKLPSRPNCSGHLPYTRRHFLFGSVAATGASLLTSHADAEVVAARNASPRSSI